MMNKTKSARVNLLRFAFILPLLAVILLAFRNVVQHQPFPLPLPPQAPYVIIDTVPSHKAHAMPDNARNIDVEYNGPKNGRVTITLKNGEVERYDLSKEKERKAFEKKYGELPEPPEPPVAVTGVHDVAAPVAPDAHPAIPPTSPVAIVPGVDAAPAPVPATPPAPQPYHASSDDCFNKKGYCITIADNAGECVVIVKNKEMKIVEAVALTDWDKNKHYTEQYGDIPPVHIKTKPGAPAKPARVRGSGIMGTDGSHRGEAIADKSVIAVKDRIELIIDKNTTKEDIERMSKRLQEHDCTLIINSIEYQNGRVKNISGMIKSNDGRRRGEFSSGDITNGGGVMLVSNKGEKENTYISIKTP